MSYNISAAKYKELSLTFDLLDIVNHKWFKTLRRLNDNTFQVDFLFDTEMTFNFVNNRVDVTELDFTGEGSGSFYGELIDLLKKSKGMFEAVFIWEGGESLNKLKCVDGVVTETKIEL